MNKDRIDIYIEERKLLVEAQQVSSQHFDKYVLSLSTGFLSLSVAFIKDIFPIGTIIHKEILVTSWVLFSTSILLTLVSFLVSQLAYRRQLQITEDYYVREDKKALEAKNRWSTATMGLNFSSAIVFVAAVATTVFFVSVNFTKQ